MKIKKLSPKALQIACLALSDAVPGLTEAHLEAAVRGYEPTGQAPAGPVPGVMLTLKEVAERVKLSMRSVERLIETGRLKTVLVGTGAKQRKVRVSEKELLRFEESGGEV